jgi:hypothetical protein
MKTIAALLFAASVLANSAVPASSEPPVTPEKLRARAADCANIENFGTHDGPMISLNVLTARDGTLQALLFIAAFRTEMPGGPAFGGDALYYQYDDGPPAMIESKSPSTSLDSYFQRLVFAGLTLGPHRLAYGLVGRDSGFLSYGQRCFVVHNLEAEQFTVTDIRPRNAHT